MRFWCIDGARATCPNCGVEHEVECGEMLDLTSGETSEIALLLAVSGGIHGGRFEKKN